MSGDADKISFLDAIPTMQQGSALLKCGRVGSPHFRTFILSEDMETLSWTSPKKKSNESSVCLSLIQEIRLGQKTMVFQRNPLPEYEPFSFSLIYEGRTLDIICKDKIEFTVWVTGLKGLTVDSQDHKIDSEALRNPQRLSMNSDQLSVSFRGSQTIVVKREDSNDVYTWGHGVNGRLGHGDEVDHLYPKVVQSLLGKEIRAVSCGPSHTAVLNVKGEIFTWGAGTFGRLGQGQDRHRFTPTVISSLNTIKINQVACGDFHSAAVSNTGKVYTWGKGDDGRLGLGDEETTLRPTILSMLDDYHIVSIDCGYVTSAAVSDAGDVFTWGGNEKGQLGHGDKKSRSIPTLVKELCGLEVIGVACATWHTAAYSKSGIVYTWGNGSIGKLGHANEEDQFIPMAVEGIDSIVTQIACGDFHTAVLTDKGVIYTWGEGNYGQLGHGPAISKHSKPLPILKPFEDKIIAQIACGANHTAAVTDKGQLYSWGYAVNGRLGHGDETNHWSPKVVITMVGKTVRQIACGGSHSTCTVTHTWIPDSESDQCMGCKRPFTFVNRRHHCRNCGGIFCGVCSGQRFPLLKDGFHRPVRVCDRCHTLLSKEMEMI